MEESKGKSELPFKSIFSMLMEKIDLDSLVSEVISRCEGDKVNWTSIEVGATVKFKILNEKVCLILKKRKTFNEVGVRTYREPREEFIKELKRLEKASK